MVITYKYGGRFPNISIFWLINNIITTSSGTIVGLGSPY